MASLLCFNPKVIDMFDIIRSIKRITGLNNQQPQEVSDAPLAGHTLEHKLDKLSGFFGQVFDQIINEYHTI